MIRTSLADGLRHLKPAIIGAGCLVAIEVVGLSLTQSALLSNVFWRPIGAVALNSQPFGAILAEPFLD